MTTDPVQGEDEPQAPGHLLGHRADLAAAALMMKGLCSIAQTARNASEGESREARRAG
jgi:hypothetical protein